MSHFYGTIQGSRGKATRAGTPSSGLFTETASYDGCVEVTLTVRDGVDWAHVCLKPWRGTGVHRSIYDGPVGGPQGTGDFDKALRCRTCVDFKNWQSYIDGSGSDRRTGAPLGNTDQAEQGE